jgi:hypothetical protein
MMRELRHDYGSFGSRRELCQIVKIMTRLSESLI